MLSPNTCNEETVHGVIDQSKAKKKKRRKHFFEGTKAKRSAHKLRELRAKETAEQRAARLEYMRIMARERRASETREQKEERLALLRRNAKSNTKSKHRWLKERQEIEEAARMSSLIKEKSMINFNNSKPYEPLITLSDISSYNNCNHKSSYVSIKSGPVRKTKLNYPDKGQMDPFSPKNKINLGTENSKRKIFGQSQHNTNSRTKTKILLSDNKTKENNECIVNKFPKSYLTCAQLEILNFKKPNCSSESAVYSSNPDAVKDLCNENSVLFDQTNLVSHDKPKITLKPIYDLI